MNTVGKKKYIEEILMTDDIRLSIPQRRSQKAFSPYSSNGQSMRFSRGRLCPKSIKWWSTPGNLGICMPGGASLTHSLRTRRRRASSQRPHRKSRPKRTLKLKPISRPIFICKAVNLLSVTARL